MTQKEHLLRLFRENNSRLTLGQILNTNLSAAYRGRISELRREGYSIEMEHGKKPSENLYVLKSTPFTFDSQGQGILI